MSDWNDEDGGGPILTPGLLITVAEPYSMPILNGIAPCAVS